LPSKACSCILCGKEHPIISQILKLCPECIRLRPEDAEPYIQKAHQINRASYQLPPTPPKTMGGIPCNLCSNQCLIGEGERGYCGLRENIEGQLRTLTAPDQGIIQTYPDPHPTNCCAAWFCPGGTGLGYPAYARNSTTEIGCYNYAVFFYGCNFDCLFCQNSSHKNLRLQSPTTVQQFIGNINVNPDYTCICHFGGSPEPQLPFAINASRLALESNSNRILRICFEWNGCGNPDLVREAAELVSKSGGNLKFDFKAFDPTLSLALSGVTNTQAYDNFKMIAEEFYEKRSEIPVLTATTLLVPGYVDHEEVEHIAQFIATLNKNIPYSLLIFHPAYQMRDLPVTPASQISLCYQVAKKHLDRVNIGNLNLLESQPPI
jgi:pyruvate formate lyase activating enzyme